MTDLVAPVIAALVILYAPGYLLLRAAGVSWRLSLGLAPAPSIAAYAVLGTAYGELGVLSSWETVFLPTLVAGIVALVARRAAKWRRSLRNGERAKAGARSLLEPADAPPGSAADALAASLYVVAGCATWVLVFGLNAHDASSFSQAYDNVHHLGTVETFLRSGFWSSFSSSLYAPSEQAFNPTRDGFFYPSAWHCVVALAAEVTGAEVTVSANAVNAAFCMAVYPLGMFSFIRYVIPGKQAALYAGALVTSAFGVFPWRLLTFGPIFPNLAAFALVPSTAACFVVAVGKGRAPAERAAALLTFVAAAVAEALLQPNAVFTLAVLLAPYCVGRIAGACLSLRAPRPARMALALLASAAFLAAAAAAWVALYNSSFMSSVVSFEWPAFASPEEATWKAATFAFGFMPAQPVLAALAAIGAVCSLRRPRCPWVAVALLAMCAIYAVSISTDGPLKHLLSGFWYTDRYRVSSCVAMFATPLAALGLALPADLALAAASRAGASRRARLASAGAGAIAAFAAFALVSYVPCAAWDARGGDARESGALSLSASNVGEFYVAEESSFYSDAERAFVERVREAVPQGSLVINVPHDGSVFSYGADGLRTYYRYVSGYGPDEGESAQSRIIRKRLSRLASDDEVRRAVRETGAEYVMLLDHDAGEGSGQDLYPHDDLMWEGISSVTDETPGFQVVLAEGDMRLYRIAS